MTTPLDCNGQPNPFFNLKQRTTRTVDELLGLCKGILADGVVTESETIMLDQYIQTHTDALNEWPANVLARRLEQIFEDAIVTTEEREDLKLLLEEVTGANSETVALGNRSTTLPLNNPQPEVVFQGKRFCLTGKFIYGARSACEDAVKEHGGIAAKTITKTLDYLVIGLLSSRDWVHSTYGRKIEKVVDYREKGVPCAIVSEKHWASFL